MTLLFEKYTYWVVDYTYPETVMYGEYSGKKGRFFLELFQDEEIVRGLSIEENYDPYISNPKILGGKITGKIRNEKLNFQKTYRLRTGLKQILLFQARVDFQNGMIFGSWNHSKREISNLPDGEFQMFLDEGEFLKSSIIS